MSVDVADRAERIAAKAREAAEHVWRTLEFAAEQMETSAALADQDADRQERAGRSDSAARERLVGSRAREAARRARLRADYWRQYRPESRVSGAARRLAVREGAADRRDRVADVRESIANERELLADHREEAADARERLADELTTPREGENAGPHERAEQAAARQRAAAERAQAAIGRELAATERHVAREHPPE